MYTSSDPFTCRHSQSDKEHGYKKYGYGKWNFVDGNVTSHFQTIITNPQINASGIEVTENLLKLLLESAIKTSQFFIDTFGERRGKKIHTDSNSLPKCAKILRGNNVQDPIIGIFFEKVIWERSQFIYLSYIHSMHTYVHHSRPPGKLKKYKINVF